MTSRLRLVLLLTVLLILTSLASVAPASDTCSACSDTACAGKAEFSECMPGFRCIPGPACTSSGPSCKCEIIG